MNTVTVQLASWTRFVINGFGIEPSLLGASHDFTHQGHQVSIELPADAAAFDTLPGKEWDNARALVHKVRSDTKEPLGISIDSVDVRVTASEMASLPAEALSRHPIAFDLFSEAEQNDFHSRVETMAGIARAAFELWLRVARWKTDRSYIGRPAIVGHDSGRGTYLVDPATKRRYWSTPLGWTLGPLHDTAPAEWNEIGAALTAGVEPPVHVELLHDAIEHRRHGELQRSVLETAMACEVYLRRLLERSLPAGLLPAAADYLLRMPISTLRGKPLREVLTPSERTAMKPLKSSLTAIFTSRNKIAHSGRDETVTQTICEEMQNTAKALFAVRPI